ncbi:hypothetical protein CHS0354_000314 [Potamilus streckersoni]|uniref:Formamidopyrimidine-DNA glycosylase catalytic domain-containing protein n=1 Tax=Potamilus streckersoni TaxID=2493646 RepID=A0AAE0SAM0_9BIVA|nr:hypothetical protein CHS0354_000314 [Potamilus streckersoni]
MPEGPELHLSSRFVNFVCKNRIFGGKIIKSLVSRQPDVEWDAPYYTISAASRGKEVKLTLTSQPDSKNDLLKTAPNEKPRTLDIIFQFGMSGKFDFYEAGGLVKHAHLNFFTVDEPKMVLSFVDFRRFGKWHVGADWSEDRGPCVLFEYPKFRENVMNSLDKLLFNRPICEVMLNQQYFNGIGNYLRAEILYRLKIPPFVSARSVLEPLVAKTADDTDQPKIKIEGPDFLQLCNLVPLEVINLGGTGYDPKERGESYSAFDKWLQCYYQPNMKNMADHNKRTIWYSGPAGPMAPTVKVTGKKQSRKKKKKMEMEDQAEIKKIKLEEKSISENENLKEMIVRSKKINSAAKDNVGVPHVEEMKKESRKRKMKLEKGIVEEKNGNAASDFKVCKHTSLTDLKLSDYPTDGTRVTRSRVKVILKEVGLKQKPSRSVNKNGLQNKDGVTAENKETNHTKIKKRSARGKRASQQK